MRIVAPAQVGAGKQKRPSKFPLISSHSSGSIRTDPRISVPGGDVEGESPWRRPVRLRRCRMDKRRSIVLPLASRSRAPRIGKVLCGSTIDHEVLKVARIAASRTKGNQVVCLSPPRSRAWPAAPARTREASGSVPASSIGSRSPVSARAVPRISCCIGLNVKPGRGRPSMIATLGSGFSVIPPHPSRPHQGQAVPTPWSPIPRAPDRTSCSKRGLQASRWRSSQRLNAGEDLARLQVVCASRRRASAPALSPRPISERDDERREDCAA